MAAKKATHTVLHDKQYLAVDGVLVHVPKGTAVALEKEHAEADAQRPRPLFALIPKGRTLKVGETVESADAGDSDGSDE